MFVVEVDVCDKWYFGCLGNGVEGCCWIFVWVGDVYYVGIGFFVVLDLVDCCGGICCWCIGYGLDCDWCVVVDF